MNIDISKAHIFIYSTNTWVSTVSSNPLGTRRTLVNMIKLRASYPRHSGEELDNK